MRILFIGDVVGGPGAAGSPRRCRELRESHRPDLVIVNGENSAGGSGSPRRPRARCSTTGADVITTGNHVYRHREVYDYLEREQR